jgi:hypothetical protein
MKRITSVGAVLALLTLGCWKTGSVSPVGSCLALGFGAWSGHVPEGLTPERRRVLPHFRLSADRARWPRDETWYEVRPLDFRDPIGPFGWETLGMWLTPSPDSLILFRVGEGSWALYIAGTWHADTLRGRAHYREGARRVGDARSNVYAVRYDCSSFHAIAASRTLTELLAQDLPHVTGEEVTSERVLRVRIP